MTAGTRDPGVLLFGEALVGYGSVEPTLRTAQQFTRFPGGADLNVAVGLSLLGIRATWASVLGDDAHGDYLADAVAQHAEALLTGDVLEMEGIDHLHLTGISLGISPAARAAALRLLEAARAAGLSVSFDPNLRLNLWPNRDEMLSTVNAVAARASVVMPGLGEGRLLTGYDDPDAIAETYLRAGACEVVIKLGAAGAFARTSGGETARSRSFAVTPIDTVGAGDGFAAGYLAGRLSGAGLQERLDQAAATGALVTTRRGDLSAMPTRAEVEELLARAAPQESGTT